jgi:hypothetical protein
MAKNSISLNMGVMMAFASANMSVNGSQQMLDGRGFETPSGAKLDNY